MILDLATKTQMKYRGVYLINITCVKYWRVKGKLSKGKLFEGKNVFKKREIKKCMKKTFSKSNSVGYKKMRT